MNHGGRLLVAPRGQAREPKDSSPPFCAEDQGGLEPCTPSTPVLWYQGPCTVIVSQLGMRKSTSEPA